MCSVYFTTPEADFADSPELLATNNLGCIESGEGANIWYEGLSDCYAVVQIFDEAADLLYSNGFELCTRDQIVITDDDIGIEGGDDESIPDVVVEAGSNQLGYLEIINTSSQQLCQVYFQALEDGSEDQVYRVGEEEGCLAPGNSYFLEYSLITEDCAVRVSIETGFLDVLYDEVVDVCEQTEILVSD